MKYTTAKEKVNEIRKKLSDSKHQLEQLEENKIQLLQDFENSYQSLVDARAEMQVGDGSKKDVEGAEQLNKKLKKELETVKEHIAVTTRSIEILKDKLSVAIEEFQQVARQHHKAQIEPVTSRIAEAMQSIDKELNTLQECRQKLHNDGLSSGSFMLGITSESEILINTKSLSGMDKRYFLTLNKITQ